MPDRSTVSVATPGQGIRDTFLSVSAKIQKAQFLAEHHIFNSDFGSIDFGDEFDVGVSYPLMQNLTGKPEYADYNAVDAASRKLDTQILADTDFQLLGVRREG